MEQRKPFSDSDADKVWVSQFGAREKATDVTGEVLNRHGHGSQGDVDHKKPLSRGGSNAIDNLQVLHKKENAAKGDFHPMWTDTKGIVHKEN